MAEDYGIMVSNPSESLNTTNAGLLMSTKYPMAKIDTTNPQGFKTTQLLFNNDPPEPVGTGTATTVVYSYLHGYKYKPQFWPLTYMASQPSGLPAFSQTYFIGAGIVSANSPGDEAAFNVIADTTSIYFVVQKYNNGIGLLNPLVGMNLQVTVFVFVDELAV